MQQSNNIDNQIPEELKFPKTLDLQKWSKYLGRNLTFEEKFIMVSYRSERCTNDMLHELYNQCFKKNKYYVPMLTHLDGNCMFESLAYHGICENHTQLRTIISTLLYIFKDYKNFLPNTNMSFFDMFTMTNEIEYVICRKYIGEHVTKEFYKYTYNVMCQDVASSSSWSKLPTQLIMLIISYVYKLEIVILSNHGEYEHKINAYETIENSPELKTIYLGHLGESHYVPVDVLKHDEECVPLYYTDAKRNLLTWGHEMENAKIKNYFNEIERQKMRDAINDTSVFKEIENTNNDDGSYIVFF